MNYIYYWGDCYQITKETKTLIVCGDKKFSKKTGYEVGYSFTWNGPNPYKIINEEQKNAVIEKRKKDIEINGMQDFIYKNIYKYKDYDNLKIIYDLISKT